MFGRGTWAILGLAKDSLEAFRTSLEDRPTMAACSQLAAVAVTRQFSSDSFGINPFHAPRRDEEQRGEGREQQRRHAEIALHHEDRHRSIPADEQRPEILDVRAQRPRTGVADHIGRLCEIRRQKQHDEELDEFDGRTITLCNVWQREQDSLQEMRDVTTLIACQEFASPTLFPTKETIE